MGAAAAHRAAVIRVEARLGPRGSAAQRASIETRHQSGLGQGVELEGNDGAWPGFSALEQPQVIEQAIEERRMRLAVTDQLTA